MNVTNPPSDADAIRATFAAARRAVEAERPVEALPILRDLLTRRPDLADARFELGRALAMTGDAEGARAAFEAVLEVAPGAAPVWVEYALAEYRAGRGAAFRKRIRKAALPAPVAAMADGAAQGTGVRAQGIGAATRRDLAALSGDPKGVEARAVPILKAGEGAAIWTLLGQARLARGARAEAAQAFRAGLALEPLAVDARLGLARALAREDGLAALAEARRAARAAPAWAEAQVTFGRLCLRYNLTERAGEAAQAALAAAPRADPVLALAAEVALTEGAPDRALDLAARRKAGARDRAFLLARAAAAAAAKQSDVALGHFAEAFGEGTDPTDIRIARSSLLRSLGRIADSEADLTAILSQRPEHGGAAVAMAYGRKLDPEGPEAASMRAALDAPVTGADDRRLLGYALARVMEKSDPAASFAHLAQANAATAAAWPYDAEADREELARLTGRDWEALRASGAVGTSRAAPIFVTGLPRSGTTLVEAILAAHPGVRAGGELAVLQPALLPLDRAIAGGEVPDTAMLDAAAERYLRAADAASGGPDPRRLTDKSIHSFVRIGQIRAILPHARIVVVRRDARDTALSIWRNTFRDGTQRYAATPEGIAAHVALFRDAVEAWRAALPGSFHEIAYEALLEDPEGESRRLLAACDLDWDPGVLSFHERVERVDTLSFAQVRQPLYRSSKGGWRAVEAHMGPLLEALARHGVLPQA